LYRKTGLGILERVVKFDDEVEKGIGNRGKYASGYPNPFKRMMYHVENVQGSANFHWLTNRYS